MLLVEEVERLSLSERQVVATFMAAGAKGLSLPDPVERRKRFDASLVADAQVAESDRTALLEVLGLKAS